VENVKKSLEIERVVNLCRGFGWEKTAEKIEGDKIILTIEKTLESPASSESPA